MEPEENGLPPFRAHPEWRVLKEQIGALLETKRQFTYDELKQIAGVDIQTPAGRAQFYIFRRHALKEWNLWFEVVPNLGYEVIKAGEHSKAAVKRVRHAGSKVKMAKAIQTHVKLEDMTPQELYLHAHTTAIVESLAHQYNRMGRKLGELASKYKLGISEEELKSILVEPPGPAKEKTGRPSKFRINPPPKSE